jgi:hypothetical protein
MIYVRDKAELGLSLSQEPNQVYASVMKCLSCFAITGIAGHHRNVSPIEAREYRLEYGRTYGHTSGAVLTARHFR